MVQKNKMQKASNNSRWSKVNLSKGRQSKLRQQNRNTEKWGENRQRKELESEK